jgi:protein SCO1/2
VGHGWSGSVIAEPVPAPTVILTDTDGRHFDLGREALGRITLLFFGYTTCPDICPVHMGTLGSAFQELEPEVRDQIRVVFVSTDPERDTPEVLRAWLDGFDRSFVGLRGSLDDINGALAGLKLPGVAVMPSEHEGEMSLIGHPSAIVAFDREGMARVRFPFGMRRSDWSRDLPRLVGEF